MWLKASLWLLLISSLLVTSTEAARRKIRKRTFQQCSQWQERGVLNCKDLDRRHFCCDILDLKIQKRQQYRKKSGRNLKSSSDRVTRINDPEPIQRLLTTMTPVIKVTRSSEFSNHIQSDRPKFKGGQRRHNQELTETSTESRQDLIQPTKAEAITFDKDTCVQLKVPCRFVSDHPCCQFEMSMDLVGRPRAMDGSADLRWRSGPRPPQGGPRTLAGRSLKLPPLESSSQDPFKPKYTFALERKRVQTPVYHFRGDTQVISTILGICWRLHYLRCDQPDFAHPCCHLVSDPGPSTPADNRLTRWLRRGKQNQWL